MYKKAFTLVELLIVIVIIGILAIMALSVYNGMVNKVKYREPMDALCAIARAEFIYYYQYGAMTTDLNALDIVIPPSKIPGSGYYITGSSPYSYVFAHFLVGPNATWTLRRKIVAGISSIPQGVSGPMSIYLYGWYEDLPGQIGGGTYHYKYTPDGWNDIKQGQTLIIYETW